MLAGNLAESFRHTHLASEEVEAHEVLSGDGAHRGKKALWSKVSPNAPMRASLNYFFLFEGCSNSAA